MDRLFGATLPSENNIIDPSAVDFGKLAKSVANNSFAQAAIPAAAPLAYGMNAAQTYDKDSVQNIGAPGGSPGNTFPFNQAPPVVAARTQAPVPAAAPIATPDTRPAPATDQGMNWAKAAQSAVKGFGITPKGQEIQSMGERGLVKDSQGRWVPSEALQQAVEANYQAGIAARNPSVQAPVATKSDTAGVITIKRPTISAFDMSFVGKADMSNPSFRNAMVAKEEYARERAAMESDRRAAEKQQEFGLREGTLGIQRDELGFRKDAENAKRGLQEKELAARVSEAPSMRALREAQTQQAMAEAGLTIEKKRLYPETIMQSQKAAQEKATGASLGKIQSNIFKLETELRQAITPEQKAAVQKAIANQKLQYDALLK